MELRVQVVLLQSVILFAVRGDVTIENKGSGTIVVQRGRGFSLKCSSDSDAALQWYHNGRRLSLSAPPWRLLAFNTPGGARHILSVRRAEDGVAGRYQCRNTANIFDYDQVRVHFKGEPPVPLVKLLKITQPVENSTTVGEGGAVSLKCVGDDSAQLKWYRNGESVTPTSRVIISTSRDAVERTWTSLLTLLNVREGDSGPYRCQDERDIAFRDHVELFVTPANVSRNVRITEPDGHLLRVVKGVEFTIKCEAGENGMVEWRHRGLTVVPSLSHMITTTRVSSGLAMESLLTIKNATYSDTGVYICQDTKDYFNRDQIHVFITKGRKGLEVKITTPLDNETSVKLGGSFTIQCVASYSAIVRWELNGACINESSNVIITPSRDNRQRTVTSLLTVMNADADYVGRFVCRQEGDFFNFDDIEISLSPYNSAMTLTIEEPSGNYVTVLPGHYLVIKCAGARGTTIRWRHNGLVLNVHAQPGYILTSLLDVRHQTITAMLTILNIDYRHAGVYTCEDAADYLNSDRVGVRVPAHVNITGGDQTVYLNSGVEIHCLADYYTQLEWLFNNTLIDDKRKGVSTSHLADALTGKVTGILRVAAGNDVFGKYTCRDKRNVENSDTAAVTIAVNVEVHRRDRVEITHPAQKVLTVREGRSFSFRCQANQGAAVFWSHDGLALLPSSDVRITTSLTVGGEQISGVTVMAATPESGGSYVCGDQLDYYNRDEVRVHVQERHPDPITILHPIEDSISLDGGQPFSLICAGPQSTRPSWYHNGHPVGFLPNVLISSSLDVVTNKLTLILARLSPGKNASGIYTCRDMNAYENADDVEVLVTPVNTQTEGLYIEENTAVITVRVRQPFKLRCRSEKRYSPIWKRNGHRLQDGMDFLIDSEAVDSGVLTVLTVELATLGHSGDYRCEDEHDDLLGQDIAVVVSI